MSSPKFKESISPTKRSNLIKMVKTHTSSSFYNPEQSMLMNDNNKTNQYYIDTLQGGGSGAEDNMVDDLNTISINRVAQQPAPSL